MPMLNAQSSPEQQSSDWETLATLTGFVKETAKASSSAPSQSTNALTPTELNQPERSGGTSESSHPTEGAKSSEPTDAADDLLDPEDFDAQAETKSQFWTNPLAKGGFVAGLVGVGIGGIGLFLHSVQGMKPSIEARTAAPQAPQDTAPPVDPKQEEIAKLKTVNALGTQAQALKQNQATANVKTLPTAKSKVAPTNRSDDRSTARPIVTNSPRALPTVAPVATEYGNITRPPLPVVRPVRPAAMINPIAPVSQAATVLPKQQQSFDPQADPQTAWRSALDTGSYGQANDQRPDPSNLGSDPSSPTLVDSRTSVSKTQDKSLTPEAQSDSELRGVTDDSRYERDTTAILSEVQSNYSTVGMGITASATLVTPIVWATDLKIDSTRQFLVQLDRPMVADGKIVLDQGTRLIAQVEAASDGGVVQMMIVAIVKATPEGDQIVSLPKGAISVSAADGRPLVADRQSRNRQSGVDIGTVLSGALTQVGSNLTQPQSQTTTTSPYTASTSITNGNRNLLGSVLQGAFGSVTQQLQQRNQQQTQTVQQQDFWTIPAGQRLRLTVTASFGVGV